MSIDPPWQGPGGNAQDLVDLDVTLARLLPMLLLGRFDAEVHYRWVKARGWVSSAQEGDWVMDIQTMSIAVHYLTWVVDEQDGPHEWPDIWHAPE